MAEDALTLLKGYRSEGHRTPEDIKTAWLRILPRLAAGI